MTNLGNSTIKNPTRFWAYLLYSSSSLRSSCDRNLEVEIINARRWERAQYWGRSRHEGTWHYAYVSKSFLSAEIEHLTSVEIVSLSDTYPRGGMAGLSWTSGQHTGVQIINTVLTTSKIVPEIAALSTDNSYPAPRTRFAANPVSWTCALVETATMRWGGKGNRCTCVAADALIEEEKEEQEQEKASVVIHCFCSISANNGSWARFFLNIDGDSKALMEGRRAVLAQ